MVPIMIETLQRIKDAGETELPGSFLSHLHQDLDAPLGLAFSMRKKRIEEDGVLRTCHRWSSGQDSQLHWRMDQNYSHHLQTLARGFLPGKETTVIHEWQSFKEHFCRGA
ncbi:hypothetical protein SKAU_G00286100 [Synaphobranchus kaupii]|uniref:Uncharacterized protein n=1 Tax=Synaphobranchus kaupii TaxID=118154 RepID=A0A9Q1EY08_SYNKA|nr:hypothetical protein SKAU_G00286100 [Synaphobranchus kaupii]